MCSLVGEECKLFNSLNQRLIQFHALNTTQLNAPTFSASSRKVKENIYLEKVF